MPAIPIDETELATRVAEVVAEAVPGAHVSALQPLTGGTSSITYQATYQLPDGAPVPVVVKVAPAGLEPVRNRDVLRQARIQRALEGSGVPAPRVIAEHPGGPLERPPFFVMSFEEGECLEPNLLPAEEKLAPQDVRERELHAARILGTLHSLDPVALGIGDEPEVSLDEELAKWAKTYDACDPDQKEGHEEINAALRESMPAAVPSVLMHGDYRLGNTLSRDGRVISVIDWEIWSRGDGRVDLAWFLMMAVPDEASPVKASPGMPSRDELIAAYTESRGAEVGDMGWFMALAHYKQAAAGAFIERNTRRRGQPVSDSMVAARLANVAAARRRLGLAPAAG